MNHPHEGATLNGLHVLTDAELNRTIHQAILDDRAERIDYETARRRANWRRSSRKRFGRYWDLCNQLGVPHRRDWTRHLHELEHPCCPHQNVEKPADEQAGR